MGYLHAFILGVVEGITEFLPISSTGHLVLASRLLGLATDDFLKSFEVIIQAGAIMAVLTLYGRALMRDLRLVSRIAVAFIPTAVAGLLLYRLVKGLLGDPGIVLWALGIGGVLLIVFEKSYREPADASEDLSLIPYRHAFAIGAAQCFALIPGVSRSATTIVAGLALGWSRRAIVEFSFLLAIPTLGAATLLDIIKSREALSGGNLGFLLVGFATSWLVAWAVIAWLLRFIRTHDFTVFGLYRIAAAIALFFVIR